MGIDRILIIKNVYGMVTGGDFVTALRQSAMRELEKIPEDKISLILQIMQGVNSLYNDDQSERKEAFTRLEKLRKKGSVMDYDAEFSDFEDCLQMECAKAYRAEYIVTRNMDDYQASEIKPILPGDYLELQG